MAGSGEEGGALQLARELLKQVDGKLDALRDSVHEMRLEWAETQGQRLTERLRVAEGEISEIKQWQAQRIGYAIAASAGVSLLVTLGGLVLTAIALFAGSP